MTIAHLLTGLISLTIGSILYYFLIPKTEESVPKQKANISFLLHSIPSLLRPMIGFIFILLGLLRILTFCLGIDDRNYTPENEDDINLLNGSIILICALSLDYHIGFFIKKIKECRTRSAKQENI